MAPLRKGHKGVRWRGFRGFGEYCGGRTASFPTYGSRYFRTLHYSGLSNTASPPPSMGLHLIPYHPVYGGLHNHSW